MPINKHNHLLSTLRTDTIVRPSTVDASDFPANTRFTPDDSSCRYLLWGVVANARHAPPSLVISSGGYLLGSFGSMLFIGSLLGIHASHSLISVSPPRKGRSGEVSTSCSTHSERISPSQLDLDGIWRSLRYDMCRLMRCGADIHGPYCRLIRVFQEVTSPQCRHFFALPLRVSQSL